jgi:hypothetical protein
LGAFHTGIEVHGREYSYGYNDSPAHTGVFILDEPRVVPNAQFRISVLVGWTNLGSKECEELIDSLKPDFLGLEYHILNR